MYIFGTGSPIVEDNEIFENQCGVEILDQTSPTVQENYIHHNHNCGWYSNVANLNNKGILVDGGGGGGIIKSNKLHNNIGGIEVEPSSQISVLDNIVPQDNEIGRQQPFLSMIYRSIGGSRTCRSIWILYFYYNRNWILSSVFVEPFFFRPSLILVIDVPRVPKEKTPTLKAAVLYVPRSVTKYASCFGFFLFKDIIGAHTICKAVSTVLL